MSKFCHKHFPETVVTTIEISREVLAMRSTFMVPANNDFFKVLEGDGAKYLSQKTHISEVILLDGYNGDGLPDVLCSEQFYAAATKPYVLTGCWSQIYGEKMLTSVAT